MYIISYLFSNTNRTMNQINWSKLTEKHTTSVIDRFELVLLFFRQFLYIFFDFTMERFKQTCGGFDTQPATEFHLGAQGCFCLRVWRHGVTWLASSAFRHDVNPFDFPSPALVRDGMGYVTRLGSTPHPHELLGAPQGIHATTWLDSLGFSNW